MRYTIESNIQIRPGKERDCETLARFNVAMAHETEGKKLRHDVVASGVRQMLRHPERGFYIVAEADSSLIGSLMVTAEWSDWRNGFFWWIQSVYIDPGHRRKGIFRSLYGHVKTMAEERDDICGFRLYVEQENRAAQATYASLGMQETSYRMYEETVL